MEFRIISIITIILYVTFTHGQEDVKEPFIPVDCNGKAFYCTNESSFQQCFQQDQEWITIDATTNNCPPETYCDNNGQFECDSPVPVTISPITTVRPPQPTPTISENIRKSTLADSESSTVNQTQNTSNFVDTPNTVESNFTSEPDPSKTLMSENSLNDSVPTSYNQSENIDNTSYIAPSVNMSENTSPNTTKSPIEFSPKSNEIITEVTNSYRNETDGTEKEQPTETQTLSSTDPVEMSTENIILSADHSINSDQPIENNSPSTIKSNERSETDTSPSLVENTSMNAEPPTDNISILEEEIKLETDPSNISDTESVMPYVTPAANPSKVDEGLTTTEQSNDMKPTIESDTITPVNTIDHTAEQTSNSMSDLNSTNFGKSTSPNPSDSTPITEANNHTETPSSPINIGLTSNKTEQQINPEKPASTIDEETPPTNKEQPTSSQPTEQYSSLPTVEDPILETTNANTINNNKPAIPQTESSTINEETSDSVTTNADPVPIVDTDNLTIPAHSSPPESNASITPTASIGSSTLLENSSSSLPESTISINTSKPAFSADTDSSKPINVTPTAESPSITLDSSTSNITETPNNTPVQASTVIEEAIHKSPDGPIIEKSSIEDTSTNKLPGADSSTSINKENPISGTESSKIDSETTVSDSDDTEPNPSTGSSLPIENSTSHQLPAANSPISINTEKPNSETETSKIASETLPGNVDTSTTKTSSTPVGNIDNSPIHETSFEDTSKYNSSTLPTATVDSSVPVTDGLPTANTAQTIDSQQLSSKKDEPTMSTTEEHILENNSTPSNTEKPASPQTESSTMYEETPEKTDDSFTTNAGTDNLITPTQSSTVATNESNASNTPTVTVESSVPLVDDPTPTNTEKQTNSQESASITTEDYTVDNISTSPTTEKQIQPQTDSSTIPEKDTTETGSSPIDSSGSSTISEQASTDTSASNTSTKSTDSVDTTTSTSADTGASNISSKPTDSVDTMTSTTLPDCDGSTNEEQQTESNIPSSTITEETPLPPEFVCEAAGRFPHESDCHKYYVCINIFVGYYKLEVTCSGGFVFSPLIFSCTNDTSDCYQEIFKCTRKGRFADPLSKSKYYLCVRNLFGDFYQFNLDCSNGKIFDDIQHKCRRPKDSDLIVDIAEEVVSENNSYESLENSSTQEDIEKSSSKSKENKTNENKSKEHEKKQFKDKKHKSGQNSNFQSDENESTDKRRKEKFSKEKSFERYENKFREKNNKDNKIDEIYNDKEKKNKSREKGVQFSDEFVEKRNRIHKYDTSYLDSLKYKVKLEEKCKSKSNEKIFADKQYKNKNNSRDNDDDDDDTEYDIFKCKEAGVFADPSDSRRYYICSLLKSGKNMYEKDHFWCRKNYKFDSDEKKCIKSD